MLYYNKHTNWEIFMIDKNVIELLIKRGFRFIGCNQPDIGIFFKPESPTDLDVCILASFTDGHIYSSLHLTNIYEEVERKFIFNGYRNINCHFIVFTDNMDRDRILADSNLSIWLVDTLMNRIIIYENQPEDFQSLRSELENIISTPQKKPKKKPAFIPFMTIALIAINVIVFIIMEILGDTTSSAFMDNHGAMSWRHLFEDYQFYRLITCVFLHFGIEHLINNMLTLAVIGNEVERVIGHVKFIVIYLSSGIGASFISAVYNMNVNTNLYIISAGASGAIFGILGSLLVISLLYRSVRANIKPSSVIIIAVLSILNGYMNYGIDNVAHVGGLLFGIIITFISCLCTKSVIK